VSYLIVVQAPCARVSPGVFATESAFGQHLRELRDKVESRLGRLIVAAPAMPAEQYESAKDHLLHIDESEERIELRELHPTGVGRSACWLRHSRRVWRTLREAAREAEVVHAGLADDVWRPVMAMADLAGVVEDRDVIFVVDIDSRRDSWRYWKTGVWSFKSYVVNRLVYDPLKLLQVKLAPRYSGLVLLKSARMVRELGRGAEHVKSFFDTAHSAEHVVSDAALEMRLEGSRNATRPLSFVFFGRFVEYKGLDRAIRAVVEAKRRSGRSFELHLIGAGDQKVRLEALVAELGAADVVTFHAPVPYGPLLFERIERYDVQIATPLVEDTPRAAFDAMARGLPILAFDIQYYRDLAEESGAVHTSPWPDVSALADRIVQLDANRATLVESATRGVTFARDNTQSAWLDRRVAWTFEMLERGQSRRRRTSASEKRRNANGKSSTM
jgi:glycosyltransferase involved in cell wall biosynthesis